MNRTHLLLIPGLCAILSSCTSSDGRMNRGLLGAASGGLIGALLGDNLLNKNKNKSSSSSSSGSSGSSSSNNNNNDGFLEENSGLITGAVAGYAAGAISDGMAKAEVKEKFIEGYNKGRSDAIKELYWVKRDAERPSGDTTVQRRYYEVPVPEHITTDGVLVEPHKTVIEVVE